MTGPGRLDAVALSGITAVGRHGVFDFERRDGQPFIVDAILHLDLRPAGTSDDLTRTAHYGEVAEQVERTITGAPFQLIEALAEKIAADILAAYPVVEAVDITVHKPKAPIQVSFGDVAVTIHRSRQ